MVLAVGITGCGGSDDKPSKSEFITRADALCKTYNAERKQAYKALAKASSEASRQKSTAPLAAGFAREYELTKQLKDDISNLSSPSEGKAQLDDIKQQLGEQASQLQALATAARKNDVPQMQRINAAVGQGPTETRALMKQYGFKVCGAADSFAK